MEPDPNSYDGIVAQLKIATTLSHTVLMGWDALQAYETGLEERYGVVARQIVPPDGLVTPTPHTVRLLGSGEIGPWDIVPVDSHP